MTHLRSGAALLRLDAAQGGADLSVEHGRRALNLDLLLNCTTSVVRYALPVLCKSFVWVLPPFGTAGLFVRSALGE